MTRGALTASQRERMMAFLQWWEAHPTWDRVVKVRLSEDGAIGLRFHPEDGGPASVIRLLDFAELVDRRLILFTGGVTEAGRAELRDWRTGRRVRTIQNRRAAAAAARAAKAARAEGPA